MELNLDTGIYEGWNDKEGIMLCGYEWGGDNIKQGPVDFIDEAVLKQAPWTFAGKIKFYNMRSDYRYDQTIKKWFKLWGHEIVEDSKFDRTLVQTNWCNTQAPKVKGNYWAKLFADEQVDNFIKHIAYFEPRLLIFFGSEMINVLQSEKVLPRFIEIMGEITESLEVKQDHSFPGIKFKISFQSFTKCNVISLPHASGARGVADEYIERFTNDISPKIQGVKRLKKI